MGDPKSSGISAAPNLPGSQSSQTSILFDFEPIEKSCQRDSFKPAPPRSENFDE
jgi:hypothetical protein